MNQTLPEQEQLQLALSQIADARELLRLASELLTAPATAEVMGEALPAVVREARQLNIGDPPHDLVDIAQAIIHQVFPRQLAQRALQHDTRPRDWFVRVYRVSIAPRNITEPVATIVVMLAAVKFGLHHQLLLQTETRLGLAHKTPIAHLDHFLETFMSEMVEADRSDVRLNDWLEQTVIDHYPDFRNNRRLNLPNGDYILIPNDIEPIEHTPPAPRRVAALYKSPLDPTSNTLIPPGSGYRIEQRHGDILEDDDHPAYDGQHHAGLDLSRWDAYRAPVHAMRAGVVIDSVYLPKGFGNTVTIEHDDGTCLRYTHLDTKLVKKGERVAQGQQIGAIGKGAKQQFAAHLHMDMPKSRQYARAGTYYKTLQDLNERFLNPLSQIPATI